MFDKKDFSKYYFNPKPDITVYELAIVVSKNLMSGTVRLGMIPSECIRHFSLVEDTM